MPRPEPRPDFPALYDRFFDRVYGYVRCRVSSREEADEVVSRVFERALDGYGGFKPERGTVEVWLFAVARNAVRDHYRAWWRRAIFPLDEARRAASAEPAAQERLEQEEERGRLLRAMARLGQRERDILGLKFQGRLTNREIARLLELGESHVGVLVHRALGRLRAALAEGETA